MGDNDGSLVHRFSAVAIKKHYHLPLNCKQVTSAGTSGVEKWFGISIASYSIMQHWATTYTESKWVNGEICPKRRSQQPEKAAPCTVIDGIKLKQNGVLLTNTLLVPAVLIRQNYICKTDVRNAWYCMWKKLNDDLWV